MRRLATLAVVVALISPTVAAGQDYTFGDWARDQGYSPGDVMPQALLAWSEGIDSLDGIGEFDWTTTPTTDLDLHGNRLSSIESGDFSGLTKLEWLWLGGNSSLTELNLDKTEFSSLVSFDVKNDTNISRVSLRNTVLNQRALATLLDGGEPFSPQVTGIGNLVGIGITTLDLSGVDFANITSLLPLWEMDDLTDLWLVDTVNLDATDLDDLLIYLAAIARADVEGILHMTQADFDAFNAAGGGLLAAWDAEPGHHVEFLQLGDVNHDGATNGLDVDPLVRLLVRSQYDVAADCNYDMAVNGLDVSCFIQITIGGTEAVPEPSTFSLATIALLGLLCWRRKER
jgi:hypothetical protein